MPDFPGITGRRIRHFDCPGKRENRDQCNLLLKAGTSNKGDRASVRRPARHAVAVGRGRKIAHAIAAEIVDCDKTVIVAVTHERDLASVGRPLWTGIVPAKVGELMGRRRPRNRSDPQLLARRPNRELSIRREFDIFAFFRCAPHLAQHSGSAGIYINRPDLLLARSQAAGGIGDASVFVGLAAENVNQRAAIGGDAQARDRQSHVAVIVRHLARREIRARPRSKDCEHPSRRIPTQPGRCGMRPPGWKEKVNSSPARW